MNRSFLVFLAILIGNFWVWHIAPRNILVAIVSITASVTFYLYLKKKNPYTTILFCITFCVLLLLQFTTTEKSSLTYRDNDEQRVQQIRLKEYPPTRIIIGEKTKWIPAAHWLEGRNELLVLTRLENNLFENLDINVYFFANHPRERGSEEFEKFPYMLLPFFFIGIYTLLTKKQTREALALALWPLGLVTIIGNDSNLGPFALLPFFTAAITYGLDVAFGWLTKLPSFLQYLSVGLFIFLTTLVCLQVFLYAQS